MATIYDLSTGRVIAADEYPARETPPAAMPDLQTVGTATAIEDMAPVDAYMVLLQDILKKL